MPDQVKVEDLESFIGFRIAMLKFAQSANLSLANADSQISRTHAWLDGEQRNFWEGQLRKRTEAVTKARDAVRQKKLYKDSSGRTPGAVEEEKFLARCIKALEEAQYKIEAIRRWLPRLEKAADLYRSGVARLANTITVDVPRSVALLDRLAATLQEYMQIDAPEVHMPEAAPESVLGGAFSRAGDDDADPTPKADEAPADSAPTDQPAKSEDRHVGDGQ